MTAYGGAETKLFRGVFGISPFFPSHRQVSELEWQFDLFVSRAGCESARDPLECLRSKSSAALQDANLDMPFPTRTNNALFPYPPTIDGDFLQDYPYRMFEEGKFIKVPTVLGCVYRVTSIQNQN